jgi:hypothetical protein
VRRTRIGDDLYPTNRAAAFDLEREGAPGDRSGDQEDAVVKRDRPQIDEVAGT